MYTRACAHVCCCTNDSPTVHSLYNVLCFLDYQLPYGAQYLESTDCLLYESAWQPQATRVCACHRFGWRKVPVRYSDRNVSHLRNHNMVLSQVWKPPILHKHFIWQPTKQRHTDAAWTCNLMMTTVSWLSCRVVCYKLAVDYMASHSRRRSSLTSNWRCQENNWCITKGKGTLYASKKQVWE